MERVNKMRTILFYIGRTYFERPNGDFDQQKELRSIWERKLYEVVEKAGFEAELVYSEREGGVRHEFWLNGEWDDYIITWKPTGSPIKQLAAYVGLGCCKECSKEVQAISEKLIVELYPAVELFARRVAAEAIEEADIAVSQYLDRIAEIDRAE